MRLICTRETGEIPPQESHLPASWLGMLQLGFGAAWCFKVPWLMFLSRAEHPHKCSPAAGAQPHLLPQFPLLQTALRSLSDAHSPFGILCNKNVKTPMSSLELPSLPKSESSQSLQVQSFHSPQDLLLSTVLLLLPPKTPPPLKSSTPNND